MSSTPSADAPLKYADWKAPAGDGEILVWPEPQAMIGDARRNSVALESARNVKLLNAPLPMLRRQMREFLGHSDRDALIFATGHQTELYHPGVWAKDVLIDAAAQSVGANAIHIAVDTDQPKHLNLRWPGESEPITDDPAISTAAWSGLLAPPSPAHIDRLQHAADREWPDVNDRPVVMDLLRSMRRLALESTSLTSMLTDAQHEIDWSIGLRHHAMLVSPMLAATPYLVFVAHLMSRPDEFASAYNGSLAEYRASTGTTNPMRPMPDLFVGDESIESPFWLDDLSTGTRTRPSLFRTESGWQLPLVSGPVFTFETVADSDTAADALRKFLLQHNHRIASRALTLTTFLRLFVADQFVHGIGGGRYDQVTDRLIEQFFRLQPPRFSVTTATLFFPKAIGRERACLPCIKHQGHHLKHEVLGQRKHEIVAKIAALPRRSSERSVLFSDLHRQLRSAIAESTRVARWGVDLREAEIRGQEDEVLFDRELSYTVQSQSRLIELVDRYRARFSQG